MKIDDPEWWNDADDMLTHDEFFEAYNAIIDHIRAAKDMIGVLMANIDDRLIDISDPNWLDSIDAMLTRRALVELHNYVLEEIRTTKRLTDDLILAIDDGKVALTETKGITKRLLKVYDLLDQIITMFPSDPF